MSSLKIGGDIIRISAEKFKEKNPHCFSPTFATENNCAVYIGVECVSAQCSYFLQVGSPETLLYLMDGVPQRGITCKKNPIYYKYLIDSKNTTTVTVKKTSGQVRIYANLVNAFQRKVWPLPTQNSSDLVSVTTANTEMLIIRKGRLQRCGRQCLLIIGVLDVENWPQRIRTSYSEFVITATNRITELINGKTVVDYVKSNHYKYYNFHAVCENCTIAISLTPLSSGDPDIFVNRGEFRLPTLNEADYQSIGIRGDFLQIKKEDNKFRGWYTIAVYGHSNCTYSLMVSQTDSSIRELYSGNRIRQEQNRGITYYFFQGWKNNTLGISLSMYSGIAILRANVIDSIRETSLLSNLPYNEHLSSWSSFRSSSTNNLVISRKDPKFREKGVYIIGVESSLPCVYEISADYF